MYDRQLQQLQQQRLNASREQLPAIDAEIARVKRLRDEFEGVTEEVQELAATPMPKFSDAWGSIKGIGNSIRDITNALTESEDVWTTITGLIDGFIGLFQSFEQVVEIINAVSAATEPPRTRRWRPQARPAQWQTSRGLAQPWQLPQLGLSWPR